MRPPPFAVQSLQPPYRLRALRLPKRAWFFTVVLSSRAARKAALRTVPPKPSLKVPGRGASTAAVFDVFRVNRRSLAGKVLPAVCANSGGIRRPMGLYSQAAADGLYEQRRFFAAEKGGARRAEN